MKPPPRTSVFYYVPWMLLVIVAIVWVFRENYLAGKLAGLNAPPVEGRTTTAKTVDLRALAEQTDLAVKGKTLFAVNCASCHGTRGEGDGDRAASLSPKPRNYRTEKFKFGDDVVSIYNTLLKGSPGTSMPSFQLLPPEDLFAMTHYVRTLIPNPAPTTPEILAQLPESKPSGDAGPAAATASIAAVTDCGPRIPILLAMERMAESIPEPLAASAPPSITDGATIYRQRCASCHGDAGQGGRTQVLDTHPFRYGFVMPFSSSAGNTWLKSRNKFAEVVVQGIQGHCMPGQATLSKDQMNALYEHILLLAQNPIKRQ